MAGPSFSFQFTFDGADGGSTAPAQAPVPVSAVVHTRHGERFQWQQQQTETLTFTAVELTLGADGESLSYAIVNTTDTPFLARTGAIRSILTASDLQTGVYEGGFKLWECSLDLVRYVERLPGFSMPPRVLELGCGHGLPGIHALQKGAQEVVFMDYNKEVLELTTCPNVLKNVGPEAYARATFYAGAWGSVTEYMQTVEARAREDLQYDLILTAETIYTEAVTVELYEMIKRHLRRGPKAMALVAAKKYYFGTGGSVQNFLDTVNAEGIFSASVVWEEQDYRSNIREIVQLKYTEQS